VRTTLKRGIGRGASVNGNGRAILPPGPYTPVRRYRVEPPRHPGWRAAGRVATWIVGTIVLLAGAFAGGAYLWAQHTAAEVAPKTKQDKKATKQLPAAGQIVLFDRSWYNRAGVERVMGFCTQEEYDDFMRSCPQIERMLISSGISLFKYWLSVSDAEQERRFQARINDPSKRWKLSPMDLQARARWVDYSEAKDQMFGYTDIKEAPWYVIETDNKRSAHLNLLSHLLSLIPYKSVPQQHIELPPRQERSYKRPPKEMQGTPVPVRYEVE